MRDLRVGGVGVIAAASAESETAHCTHSTNRRNYIINISFERVLL